MTTTTYHHQKVAFSLLAIIWMTFICLPALLSHFNPHENEKLMPLVTFDLKEIRKRGKLVALIDNSSTSYYIYKGDTLGYEYDLLREFAQHIGVELEVVVANDMNSIYEELNSNKVDILAANLAVTNENNALADFSDPLMLVPQVLVQRKPQGWRDMTREEMDKKLIRNVVDLCGKNVHVPKGSAYYSRLLNLENEAGGNINIFSVPGDISLEDLIGLVGSEAIDYTIAPENIALSTQTYNADLDVATPVSFPQKIAWAIRKNSPELKDALNNWLQLKKQSPEMANLYDKYYKRPKQPEYAETRPTYYQGGEISPYDDLIRQYSEKIGWDWKLLAALIWQESHFSPTARSWSGANGLMQLIPATAKHYGLDTTDMTAEQSIRAGVSFLGDLDRYWKSQVQDKQERIKFVLASYNAGLGHIIDARNLAEKYGRDPLVWDGNVEDMILQKSDPEIYRDPIVKCGYCRGQETYSYVRKIIAQYHHYQGKKTEDELAVN